MLYAGIQSHEVVIARLLIKLPRPHLWESVEGFDSESSWLLLYNLINYFVLSQLVSCPYMPPCLMHRPLCLEEHSPPYLPRMLPFICQAAVMLPTHLYLCTSQYAISIRS